MSEMVFADRWMLWFLVPAFAAWLLAWVLDLRSAHRRSSVRYSDLGLLKRLATSRTVRLRRVVEMLRVITVGLLIMAMARPQTGRKHTEVRTEGVDIVLVLDTSGSMQALDLDAEQPINRRRNRLQVAKEVVEEFVRSRRDDQIGLVVFGGEAFTQCPLTLDHGILATFLERLEIGMAGDATAIGSAIGTAVKRLRDSAAKSKVIILLTDGRNNAGSLSPSKAAEIARTFDIKIYAIGAGTRGKAPFVVDSFFGKQVVYEDVEIDDAALESIASVTGGQYFRAEDNKALRTIYERIDEMEKTEIETDTYMEYNERFRLFLLPALAVLLLEIVLLGTRFRKLP